MTWTTDEAGLEDAAAQLQTFVEAGGTLVDTADVFGQGMAEAAIGQLMGKVVARSELHITTKAGVRTDGAPRKRDTSRGWLMRSLEGSLRRLDTDYIDLWILHVYDPDTPLEETMSVLDAAVSSGKVRYVGLSNHTGWQTARAFAWQSAWPGRTPVVANQVEYSLLQRGVEREVLPACLALEMGVLAWSPLGRGVLTGKYRFGRPDGLAGGLGTVVAVRRGVLGRAVGGHRRGVRDGGRGARGEPARGGAGVGAGPAGGGLGDRGRAERDAAAGLARGRAVVPAAGDPVGPRRRVGADRGLSGEL